VLHAWSINFYNTIQQLQLQTCYLEVVGVVEVEEEVGEGVVAEVAAFCLPLLISRPGNKTN
jgi:hypothetical protein